MTARLAAMTEQGEDRKHPCTNTHSDEMPEVSNDKLTVTMRKEAPSHYTLEIESFRFLQDILPKTDRYESTEFRASGHNWRLIVYPKGDKQRNGRDHISLFLEILDIQTVGRPWRIDALLNFFVYNYTENQYRSIQDGRVKRFDAVNTECGFSRILSLAEFKDKGYLSSEGSCKFGVEVFVIKSEGKGECFSTIDNPNENQFISWKIEMFSKLSDSDAGIFSKEQIIGDYSWKLHLYPKGVKKVKGEFVSIFLCLHDHQKLPLRSKMHVEFKLRMSYQLYVNNSKKIEKTGNAWFSGSETAWGFPYFVKSSNLQRPLDSTVYDDVLVEAEITSMSMTKEFFPEIKETPFPGIKETPEDMETPPMPNPD